MKKRIAAGIVICLIFLLVSVVYWKFTTQAWQSDGADSKMSPIEDVNNSIEQRKQALEQKGDIDLFGEDGRMTVLLIGMDSRAGETKGHCDAIQFFEIDRKTQQVQITAVPRGTYVPLPFGITNNPTDYYVSNSCALVGIEYGIEQIEKIIGKKADHLVVVGFSGVVGILRDLELPTTETLQWLRHRQGYAIGEPQRARNHSTFLKQMLVKYIPKEVTAVNLPLHFLIYNTIQTDLSFHQARGIINTLAEFDLGSNSDKIMLSMKPSYAVQDIPYDPESIDVYLQRMLGPIKHLLSDQDYQGVTEEEIEENLLTLINEKRDEPEFLEWAYQNKPWLQFEDQEIRTHLHFDLIRSYVLNMDDLNYQEEVLDNYILEMEFNGLVQWAQKGKELEAELAGEKI